MRKADCEPALSCAPQRRKRSWWYAAAGCLTQVYKRPSSIGVPRLSWFFSTEFKSCPLLCAHAPRSPSTTENRYLDCKRDAVYLKQTRSDLRLLRPRHSLPLGVNLWKNPCLIYKERNLMIECWAGAHTLLSARRARRSSMVGKIHVDTLKTKFFCPIPLNKPRS